MCVHMLRICISGLSCSGKTTLGDTLAKELNILHVTKGITNTYKKVVEEIKRSNDNKLKMSQTIDTRFAEDFDREVMDFASKNDCVVTTWIGPWLIKDAAIRVWLYANPEVRAKRHSEREGIGIEEARNYIKEKDENNINSFKSVYDIDVENREFFDMKINTEKLSIKEAASLISVLAIGKNEGRFR